MKIIENVKFGKRRLFKIKYQLLGNWNWINKKEYKHWL